MEKHIGRILAIALVFTLLPVTAACGGPAESGPGYKETHVHIGHEEIVDGYPQSVVEPLWWSVSIYDGEKKYNEDLSKFTLPQRYVFAIQWYVAEVNNGGHGQFYYNSSGIVYPDALQGFQEIGHQQAYDILKETIALAGGKIPLDRARREKLFDSLSDSQYDAIEELDMDFYGITDLDEKIMAYVKANESDFYFDGTVLMPDLDWDNIITFAPVGTTANEN